MFNRLFHSSLPGIRFCAAGPAQASPNTHLECRPHKGCSGVCPQCCKANLSGPACAACVQAECIYHEECGCDVTIMSAEASWQPMNFWWQHDWCLEKTQWSEPEKKIRDTIFTTSFAYHYNNQILRLGNGKTKPDTLCHHLFNKFCVLCDDVV